MLVTFENFEWNSVLFSVLMLLNKDQTETKEETKEEEQEEEEVANYDITDKVETKQVTQVIEQIKKMMEERRRLLEEENSKNNVPHEGSSSDDDNNWNIKTAEAFRELELQYVTELEQLYSKLEEKLRGKIILKNDVEEEAGTLYFCTVLEKFDKYTSFLQKKKQKNN